MPVDQPETTLLVTDAFPPQEIPYIAPVFVPLITLSVIMGVPPVDEMPSPCHVLLVKVLLTILGDEFSSFMVLKFSRQFSIMQPVAVCSFHLVLDAANVI